MSTIPSTVLDQLELQSIELPSWAFGNSGTRFKVFTTPGTPRDPVLCMMSMHSKWWSMAFCRTAASSWVRAPNL